MNLEKLGLLFLVNYVNQMGTVKNHLLLATREFLQAVQVSMEIIATSATKSVVGGKLEFIAPILAQAQSVLDYGIKKIEISHERLPEMTLSPGGLKKQVVASIVSAIDEEIESTTDTLSDRGRLKIEALETVKKVLLRQSVALDPPSVHHVA